MEETILLEFGRFLNVNLCLLQVCNLYFKIIVKFIFFLELESVIKTKNKCTKSEKVEESQTHVTQTSTKTKKVLDSLSRVDGGAAATLVDECRRLFYSQQEIKHSATNGNKYRLDTLDIFKSRDDVLKLLSSEGMLIGKIYIIAYSFCYYYICRSEIFEKWEKGASSSYFSMEREYCGNY